MLLTGILFVAYHAVAQQWSLSSPDNKIVIRINNADRLSYTVSYDKKVVINPSPLGIQLDDQNLISRLKFLSTAETKVSESYVLLVGRHIQVRNSANELVLSLENENKERLNVIFRAYNDGIAFRYQLPKSDPSLQRVTQEASGFAIDKNAKAWIQAYDLNSRKKPCYETYYENGIKPGTPSPNLAGWAFPALFNVDKTWMLISEAGLDETYCATHLEDKLGSGLYTIRFPEKEEVTSDVDPEPVSALPWISPWRVAIIGSSPNALFQSTLITDLNPPSKIKDTSWIKPGRASWSWWSQGSTPRDFEVQKKYIDFNADMGWEYVLIDAGWPQMTNGKMEDLVAYANSKGVGIFLWYHSGMGREKDTVSMSNLMAFPDPRRQEMEKIKAWGVKGIKVDFFDSDKQPVIKRYIDILQDAATYSIMVNFHGSTLPRGWERTYPHLVSMESVKGAEGAGNQRFCDMAPSHNTILPFTRNIVGSMDYTPVTFTNKREAARKTSFAHELALSLIFESGVFHFADRMESYQNLPEAPKNFLKEVPTVWDETQYLAGLPGEFVVLARRKGNQWYLAGINGKNETQEISFAFPMTKKGSVTIITDGETASAFKVEKIDFNGKPIRIVLQPNGGFIGKVQEAENSQRSR
jgi:alpha-glucosidase